MLKSLIMLSVLVSVLSVHACCVPQKHTNRSVQTDPGRSALPTTPQQAGSTDAQILRHEDHPYEIRVLSTPSKDRYDKTLLVLNFILAGVGIAGVVAAVFTLRKIERQTAATEKQANHMVDSERPFLMIEPRGNDFWMMNRGKSPAHILYVNPSLQVAYPEFVERRQEYVMPSKPEYVANYDDPTIEQINVPWLAPGDERRFATFDTDFVGMLNDSLKNELNMGHKRIRIYSAIKYRGMFSEEIYESRFCYTWHPQGGLRMDGPYGYNQYT